MPEAPSPESLELPEDQETMDAGVAVEDFINTGRTGRRNALADISDSRAASISTAGVDFTFDQLSVADSKPVTPDPSKAASPGQGDKVEAPKS